MGTVATEEYYALADTPLDALMAKADAVRRTYQGDSLELCGIVNAKSGRCSEDCKFCAQSVHHHTEATVYDLRDAETIFDAAAQAKAIGAKRFGIVTSGNTLDDAEIDSIAQAVRQIVDQLGLAVCGSLGALNADQLGRLKHAGMTRYHHNIETSRRFYGQIVTTHDFQQRLDTIAAAKDAGLEVCSGGIIGMGETWADRVDMAVTLKTLNVDAVPINILVPLEGTAMENAAVLSRADILRTIAVFRIVLQDVAITIAAGRETALQDQQLRAFQAGANGMMIGGYLTVPGDSREKNDTLIKEIHRVWSE